MTDPEIPTFDTADRVSGFLNRDRFIVRRTGDQTWELLTGLTWIGTDADRVDVEPGFITDFATSPWFTWWLIPKTGKWTLPATAHDKLCTLLQVRHDRLRAGAIDGTGPCTFGPVDTDGAFRAMLRDEGVDVVRRWLMWTGVRWGALWNPARRAGWWRTWQVWPVSGAALVAVVGTALGFARVVSWAVGW